MMTASTGSSGGEYGLALMNTKPEMRDFGGSQMNEGKVTPVETTDCLEAVSVFRGWKNFFFLVVLISLLLMQAAFWAVNLRIVEPSAASGATSESLESSDSGLAGTLDPAIQENVAAEEEELDFADDEGPLRGMLSRFDFADFARGIELVNGILIVSATLFCFSMFFSLMVSLVGRLGGIRHIARAFILSLIMLALILPWQKLLNSTIVGVVWSPVELVDWLQSKAQSPLNTIIYYLRFTGYWLVTLMLLVMAQARTTRWSKAIVRRLEII